MAVRWVTACPRCCGAMPFMHACKRQPWPGLTHLQVSFVLSLSNLFFLLLNLALAEKMCEADFGAKNHQALLRQARPAGSGPQQHVASSAAMGPLPLPCTRISVWTRNAQFGHRQAAGALVRHRDAVESVDLLRSRPSSVRAESSVAVAKAQWLRVRCVARCGACR